MSLDIGGNSSEELNSFYRLFKSKLTNLKSKSKVSSDLTKSSETKFVQEIEKIEKKLKDIEDNKDSDVPAAKRRYDKYVLLKKLKELAETE